MQAQNSVKAIFCQFFKLAAKFSLFLQVTKDIITPEGSIHTLPEISSLWLKGDILSFIC